MTLPARSATRPNPIMLLEQLARHWSRVTAWTGGLVASDRDSSVSANIHTGPMPERKNRRVPSCALEIGPATVPATNEATVRIGVVAEARGQTQDQVLSLLEDLRATVVRPNDKPFVYTPRVHGGTVQLGGIIGAPPVAHFGDSATLGVYRVIRLDPINTPQILAPIAGEGGTEEGEVSGQFTFEATCVAEVLPKPIAAFTVNHVTPGGIASISIDNGQLILEHSAAATITIDLAAGANDTIGELAVHAVGPNFTITGLNAAVSARASLDLVEISPAAKIEDVGAQPVYVWG